jgi:hypothetical protein
MNFVEHGKDHTPSITHLGVVSCEAYAQIPKERRIQSVRRGQGGEPRAFCLIDRPSFPHSSSYHHLFRYDIESIREYLRIQFITMLRVYHFQR